MNARSTPQSTARRLINQQWRRALGLAILSLVLVVGVVGCGGDDATVVAPSNMADIDTYVASLSAWPTPSPSTEDVPNGSTTTGNEAVGTTNYACSTTPYSITQTPEKIVVFDPDDEIFWLGSLLQGNGYRGGIGSLSELPIRQRGAMDIWIDILGEGTTRRVPNPSPTTVNAAIGELITVAENSGQTFASDISFNQTETRSVEQSAIKMGFSAHYLGGKATADLSYDQNAAENTVTAYFLQKMFTTSMTLPQLPSDLFNGDFTAARLQEQVDLGRIGPSNQPTYISSIVWGRLMMLTITSTSSVTDIKAALSASYDAAAGGGSGTVSGSQLATLNQSEIKLVTLGGEADAALGYLRTGSLATFFANDAPLTSAVPLSFTVRNVQTNEKALVSETTSYNIKTCSAIQPDAIGAKYRVRLDSFYLANGNCDGGGYIDAYWSVTANSPVSTSRSSSNETDFYHATVIAINSVWSSWVDVMNNGTGAITISGSMTDWDSVSDDLVAAWDIRKTGSDIDAGSFTASGGSPAGESCRVDLRYSIEKGAEIYP